MGAFPFFLLVLYSTKASGCQELTSISSTQYVGEYALRLPDIAIVTKSAADV
jgi:hypothetical protein